MATSVSSVVSHFPSAENGFTTTTSGSVSSGATTVGLNSVAGYANGEIVVFVIDPTDATKKQTFTGTIDTAGVQVTDVVWTAGTNQTHALGATVVDYATATHISMVSKGILVEHAQSGVHSAALITSRTEDTSPDLDSDFLLSYDTSAAALKKVKPSSLFSAGWSDTEDVPDTVTYNGNRSYDLVFNSNDLTDTVSNGMRLKLTRTVTAPTQCADLESGSSHYFSKTSPAGLSFTTTFTCMAWIKVESYADMGIIARRNADTEGWSMAVDTSGRISLVGLRIASNNKKIVSYQSIPLNKWVHVAATMDMAVGDTSAQKIWIDGVEVPRAYTLTGTASALVQGTTALVVGAQKSAGTDSFDGKIAQAAVFSAQISEANIRSYASQTLSGSETNLVSAYSLSNSIVDLSANANNLTAQNSAVATATDSPFAGGSVGTTEYGIITANSFSTNTTLTVQVPEGCAIPTSGGVSAVSYSTQDVPYGFPKEKGKWNVLYLNRLQSTEKTNTTYAQFYGDQLVVPIGAWRLRAKIPFYAAASATVTTADYALSTSTTAIDAGEGASADIRINSGAGVISRAEGTIQRDINLSSATTYYGIGKTGNAAVTYGVDGDDLGSLIWAEFNYV